MLACNTIKQGKECVFMKKNGCTYNGGHCHTVVEACEGCDNIESIEENSYCAIFAEPSLKWNVGYCNMSTNGNGKEDDTQGEGSKKLNPLKASKRSMR